MLPLARILFLALLSSPAFAGENPRAALVDGVHSIARAGTPGIVAVFGDNAFPVVVGGVAKDVQAPLVAAAELGSGRIVAFAHSGYFSREVLSKLDGPRFVSNCVRWSAREPKRALRVRVAGGPEDFTSFLGEQGFEARSAKSVGDLAGVDVLFWFECDRGNAGDEANVVEFVERGGGLLVAETPWGWLQLHPGQALSGGGAGNALLAKAGIAWVDGTLDETAKGAFVVTDVSELAHASRALDLLLQEPETAKWPRARAAQARWSILAPLTVLPKDDERLRPRLAKLCAKAKAVVPSAKAPVKDDGTLARLALAIELEDALAAEPDACRAHPAGEVFPGPVPRGVRRVTRTVSIDTRVPGWHSTGLYAAPGEVLEVESQVNALAGGFAIQIGAHTDDLTDANEWKRCPRVVVGAPFAVPRTRVASPFGGLVYVVVPSGDEKKPERLELTVKNAVEAPRFVLGSTDAAEWKTRIRSLPAPWAELETRKVILTLPSSVVRELDDPAALMEFWDRVLDACADLGGLAHDRPRPERYVADEQISAGYMHSGYPIMTHLDVAATFVDLGKLRKNEGGCGWGFYHEMGHNHQESEWTFEGTGEVTNNLFAVYVLDTVVKAEDERTSVAECRKRFDAYKKAGAKYEDWKRDPFLALGFFLEMKRAFGWKPFQAFFAEEAGLAAAERPRSDMAKRTQWLTRLSRLAGRDLTPWFALWNVPVDASVARTLSHLPTWIADGYPNE